jgi:hypothetical protein
MAKYSTTIVGAAASTSSTNPNACIIAAATGAGSALGLYELSLSGEASSSTFCRMVLNRPSAFNATGLTAQTPQPLHPGSVAAGYTAYSGGTGTSSTPGTVNLLVPAFNAFGGVYTWLAGPGGEIVIGTQGAAVAAQYLILYSLSGTPTVSGHLLVEQY